MDMRIESARDFRAEIEAVREGRATYAQTVEVCALCMMLHIDILKLGDMAADQRRAIEDQAVQKTLAELGHADPPRFRYSGERDEIIPAPGITWVDVNFDDRPRQP